MAIKKTATIPTQATLEDAYTAALTALEHMKVKVTHRDPSGGRLEAQIGMGLLSWGEVIGVTITPTERGCQVIVTSEARLSTTMMDYGKNQGNVNSFVDGFQRALEMSNVPTQTTMKTVRPPEPPQAVPSSADQHIFISYRRADSIDICGRIYDRLVADFGKEGVFKDVDNIPLGVDFREYLRETLDDVTAVLVVIGPDWVTVADKEGNPRLHDPNDWVRVEVESALSRDIPVVPLLVYGARMPRAHQLPDSLASLAARNGMSIRPDPDFHNDMDRLIGHLRQ